jgi:nitrite reductase/ring-hydroxylating ferredoxin subunit
MNFVKPHKLQAIPRILKHHPRLTHRQRRTFHSTPPTTMVTQYKLKGLSALDDLKKGEKKEYEVEGIQGAKVLLVNVGDKVHALSPKCTHFGAPLVRGVLHADGRLTCPWHGACFNVVTGDVEDAPALNSLTKFNIAEKEGGVFVNAEEEEVKAFCRNLSIKCQTQGSEKIVVVGG